MTKAVAAALPSYCMSVFLLPKSLCHSIDVLLKNFWWGFSKDKNRNFHPKAGADICLPKELGGLGLRRMYDLNRAMVAKLGWQVISNPECLWVKAVIAKYLRNSSFLEYQRKADVSWIWQGVEKTRELIIRNLHWKVKNGRQTLIWQHPWVPHVGGSIPKLKADVILPNPISHVVDLCDDTGHWREQDIRAWFEPDSAEAILRISRHSITEDDEIIWASDPKGKNSVRFAYSRPS